MKVIGIVGAAALLLAGCTNPHTGQPDPIASGLLGGGVGAITGYAVGRAISPPPRTYYYGPPRTYYGPRYGHPPVHWRHRRGYYR